MDRWLKSEAAILGEANRATALPGEAFYLGGDRARAAPLDEIGNRVTRSLTFLFNIRSNGGQMPADGASGAVQSISSEPVMGRSSGKAQSLPRGPRRCLVHPGLQKRASSEWAYLTEAWPLLRSLLRGRPCEVLP